MFLRYHSLRFVPFGYLNDHSREPNILTRGRGSCRWCFVLLSINQLKPSQHLFRVYGMYHTTHCLEFAFSLYIMQESESVFFVSNESLRIAIRSMTTTV